MATTRSPRLRRFSTMSRPVSLNPTTTVWLLLFLANATRRSRRRLSRKSLAAARTATPGTRYCATTSCQGSVPTEKLPRPCTRCRDFSNSFHGGSGVQLASTQRLKPQYAKTRATPPTIPRTYQSRFLNTGRAARLEGHRQVGRAGGRSASVARRSILLPAPPQPPRYHTRSLAAQSGSRRWLGRRPDLLSVACD